ncbi:MAG: DUF58 domain-containing protein [Planctomycetota bacterium]|jgi:uncharacterized protein (DUF58 family)
MSAPVDRTRYDPEVVRKLGRLDLVAGVLADGFLTGSRRSRRHGFSTEFSDFKPYVPGDDLRFVDWRVYARSEKLFVKRFEDERSYEHLLVLDCTASMSWQWKDTVSKLQYGANLVAAIACICSRAHDRVGLVAHDGDDLRLVPPQCRSSQLDAVFSVLEGVRPGRGGVLRELVAATSTLGRHSGAIVVCSDLEEDEEAVVSALEALSETGRRVYLLHLLDEAEIELPFAQATHLQDSETGRRLVVSVPSLRKRHASTVEVFRSHWHENCRSMGIRYRSIRTGMNYLDVLLGLAEES